METVTVELPELKVTRPLRLLVEVFACTVTVIVSLLVLDSRESVNHDSLDDAVQDRFDVTEIVSVPPEDVKDKDVGATVNVEAAPFCDTNRTYSGALKTFSSAQDVSNIAPQKTQKTVV